MGAFNISFWLLHKKRISLVMELYLFIIGFLVSCLVIASVFLVNKEEKNKYKDSDKANEIDYDGMGNYGRFPQKK